MTAEKDERNLPARRPRAQMTSTGARAHLECRRGPEKGETFRVAPGSTLIGRDPSCDVVLSETAISRQHCRIDRRGDVWVLTNLSNNGTRVKKQAVDEHVLSDGDEIHLGAKTRLEFVVEEVAKLVSGRPQFRARGLPVEEEEEEGETDETEPEEGQPSLFKRRRGLFIGLGVYAGVMLVIAVILGTRGCGPSLRGGEVPTLGIDEMVKWTMASKPLRTLPRQSPDGVWVENELGVPTLIPREDFESGKARHIPGIRQAIDVQYYERLVFEQMVSSGEIRPNYPFLIEKKNPGLAKQYQKEAINEFLVCHMPGKEASLIRSVRLFQQSLAYSGMRYFPDPDVNKTYLRAVKELIETIHTLYTQAIVFDRAGSPKKAWGSYQKVLKYVPEEHNPVFRNVSARMRDLRKRVGK
jgi:pSer/pThr/pTyr-binding forkhead associated (FHA) protein